MYLSQKCQYTLRALYELAKRRDDAPATVVEIARAQAIPARFLETILQQLKKHGAVISRRGNRGGYLLAADPQDVTIGDIIRLVDGSLAPVACTAGKCSKDCRLYPDCAFRTLWGRAQAAVEKVYDHTTLADLMEREAACNPAADQLCGRD